MTVGSGDFSIGGTVWPGLSKLLEEAGEVLQVGGKLIGSAGEVRHFDGSNLQDRMCEELADLYAAIDFFLGKNNLDSDYIRQRRRAKVAQFEQWHDSGSNRPSDIA